MPIKDRGMAAATAGRVCFAHRVSFCPQISQPGLRPEPMRLAQRRGGAEKSHKDSSFGIPASPRLRARPNSFLHKGLHIANHKRGGVGGVLNPRVVFSQPQRPQRHAEVPNQQPPTNNQKPFPTANHAKGVPTVLDRSSFMRAASRKNVPDTVAFPPLCRRIANNEQ